MAGLFKGKMTTRSAIKTANAFSVQVKASCVEETGLRFQRANSPSGLYAAAVISKHIEQPLIEPKQRHC